MVSKLCVHKVYLILINHILEPQTGFFHFNRHMTQSEYILPLTKSMRNLSLYRKLSPSSDGYKIKHSIPNMDASVSIRPQLCLTKKEIEQRYVDKFKIIRRM